MSALEQMRGFYDACEFRARPQDGIGDMLLYQHGSAPDGFSLINFTRQLYARGRGVQLGITFEYPRESLRILGSLTLWNNKDHDLDAWVAAVREALGALPLDGVPPVPAQLSLDCF